LGIPSPAKVRKVFERDTLSLDLGAALVMLSQFRPLLWRSGLSSGVSVDFCAAFGGKTGKTKATADPPPAAKDDN
jgi:hypothetical protein